jgi:putative ABC transport system permease protein
MPHRAVVSCWSRCSASAARRRSSRRRDIRNQFLIEAVTLASIGGAIGITIGLVAGLWLTQSFSLPFIFNLAAIALAFGVAAVVGILFGFYPAVRALRLDPIVALRSE